MPALLTSTSRRSYSERMRSARSRTAASEERSATYEPTFWLLVWPRSSSSVASRRSELRPCSSTVVPFAASSRATRLPRPSVAPVTSIVASAASLMVTPFRVRLHSRKSVRRSVLSTPQYLKFQLANRILLPAIGYYTFLPTNASTVARSSGFQVASPIHVRVSPGRGSLANLVVGED